MKKPSTTSIVLTFFSVMTLPSSGQVSYQDSVKYSHQLIRIEQQLMDDIPSGTTANWDKYTHQNWFVLTEDGTMFDKKTFLADFKPLPKGFSGYIKIINPKTVFYNNMGIINYVSDEYEFVFGQKIHTTYSSMNTYTRNDSSWTMVSSQIFEVPQLPPAIKLPGSVLKKYAGIYQLSDSITCTITLQNDTLYLQKKGRPKDILWPETENIFFRKPDTRGRKLFVQDENGTMLMRERRNGQDVVWIRI